MRKSGGVTFIEVLAVMAAVIIMALIAIPVYQGTVETTRTSTCLVNRYIAASIYRTAILTGDLTENSTANEVMEYVSVRAPRGVTCLSGGTIYFKNGKFYCSLHAIDYIFSKEAPQQTLLSLLDAVGGWFEDVDRATLSSGGDGVLKIADSSQEFNDVLEVAFKSEEFGAFCNSLPPDSLKVITTATSGKSVTSAELVSVFWQQGNYVCIAYAKSGSLYKVPKSVLSGKDYYLDENQVKEQDGSLKDGVVQYVN